jgi:two-component system phosphate regulon sensor histidine kinase PhoR
LKKGKYNQSSFLAGFTFLALVMLLIIQVTWISKAARLEEQNFNSRVNMALKGARDAISSHASGCSEMKEFLCGNDCPQHSRMLQHLMVDSIISANLREHHIDLKYHFTINDSTTLADKGLIFKSKCYRQTLSGLLENQGILIRIQFPERNQFLMAQIKGWFVISILFIVFVAVSFFITLRMFYRERKLVHQTTDFINNMVHEFQTPLTNIRLATHLIRKKQLSTDAPKIHEYTDVILRENQKMEKNVDDILRLSNPNNYLGEGRELDVHELIAQVVDHYSYRVNDAGGILLTDLKATRFVTKGEPESFSLMLSNLIDNALKYSAGNPDVLISTRNHAHHLILTVRDHGIGIHKKDLPFIFDRYYRVSTGNVHNVKGFGLGLTFVKKIVERHRGTITLKSKPGEGTEFIISIPMTDEH